MNRPMTSEPAPGRVSLEALIDEVGTRVRDFMLESRFTERFRPDHLREAVLAYLRTGGKALRPALALWSCGAAGGITRKMSSAPRPRACPRRSWRASSRRTRAARSVGLART